MDIHRQAPSRQKRHSRARHRCFGRDLRGKVHSRRAEIRPPTCCQASSSQESDPQVGLHCLQQLQDGPIGKLKSPTQPSVGNVAFSGSSAAKLHLLSNERRLRYNADTLTDQLRISLDILMIGGNWTPGFSPNSS